MLTQQALFTAMLSTQAALAASSENGQKVEQAGETTFNAANHRTMATGATTFVPAYNQQQTTNTRVQQTGPTQFIPVSHMQPSNTDGRNGINNKYGK